MRAAGPLGWAQEALGSRVEGVGGQMRRLWDQEGCRGRGSGSSGWKDGVGAAEVDGGMPQQEASPLLCAPAV